MQDNQLIKIENPFQPFNRKCLPIPFEPGRTIGDIVAISGFGDSVVIMLNGNPVDDMHHMVCPGDVIHVYPKLHNDTAKTIGLIGLSVLAAFVVGPAVSGLLQGAGWSAAAAGVAGSIATVATITAGGVILNGGMSAGNIRQAGQFEESPTYHWDIQENLRREGHAIPIVYGQASSYPTIINQWLEVDNDTGDQWAHTTLCVAEGLTNNMPTVDEIYAGDQPLSLYPTDDFTLVTTDGGASPDWTGGSDFQVPHQTRKIDRQLKQATLSQIMLHCDGADDSTTIEDSATNETNVWTCQATAALSTANPWQGTAALDLEVSGDYVSCDNYDAFNIWTSSFWTIECQFRQDTLTDAGIMGGQRVAGGGDEYYWALTYDQGTNTIIFQQYMVTAGAVYTKYLVYSGTATGLTVDTWYHICVQRANDNLYIYGDGVLVSSGSAIFETPVAPPAGTWAQAVGKAQRKDGESDSTWYGECELDEIRIVNNGNVYPLEDFTAPTVQVVNPDELIFTTKGMVDKFSITVLAPYGIYFTKTDASLDDEYVQFWVSYREVGDSAWTREYKLFTGKTRSPYRQQWEFTPPSRAKYEISISRITADEISYNGSSPARSQSTTMLAYIDESLDMALTYPYLQCIGISLKAQDEFSGIVPQFRVVSERTSIVVPNFNDVGTQTVNPTDNSYASFDMLTNDVYGAGIDPTLIIEDDWESWSDWITGMIDGYQRCQINAIFDGASTLDTALQQAENCGRARIVRRGSKISVNIDKPSTVQALFCMGNIVPGSDHVRWIRQAERADAVEIVFKDVDLDFAENSATHYSPGYHSLTRVPRTVRMSIPGINNYEQAKREAIIRQQMNDSIKKELELQSGLEAIPVTTGDVINYQASINSFTGRLPRHLDRSEEYTGTTVYLDQEINLPTATYSGNCILMVRDPDDTIQTYTVSGPFDTDTWRVTISTSGTFNFLAPFIICRNTGDVYQYKVSAMERSNQLDIKLNALQYDSTVYYNTDYEGGLVAI